VSARWRLNLALAAVVAVLAWLVLRPGETPDAPPGLALTALDPRAVTRVRIEARDAQPVALERTAKGWRLRAPLAAPADDLRVAVLLELAAARSREGFRAAGNDLAQYGLEPPRARVWFDRQMLLVGGTDPVAGRRYVLAGDQVHLLEDRWFPHLFGQPGAWVDPRPLAGAGAVTRIELPAAQWRLEAGSWRRTPRDPGTSADDGPALAEAWQRARALSVRALDPALAWDETVRIHAGERVIELAVARSRDALLLGRRDLGVQYRFLARQGRALLGTAPP